MTDKPLPHPTPISAPFWEGLTAHRIRLQRCNDCAHWIFYPRAHCPHCFSNDLSWHDVSGEGTLLTYTVSHIPTLPAFADELPQMLAVVALKEGPHVNTTLVDVQPSDLRIDMPVKPVFDDVVPGKTTLLRYTKG